ncbi:MAG: hypothetical protein GY708_03235 [Actinomycetia bacterium]|nr:hypothetical protein [Actinomycetes bacterium]
MKRWKRERWLARDAGGKGPVVSALEVAKPRRGEGVFVVSAWGYQSVPEGGLWPQPWGRVSVESGRWKRDGKRIVESLFGVRSQAELLAVDSGNFVSSQELVKKGFYDRNMAVSLAWDEPHAVEVQPLKGADLSAVGVWELGRKVPINVQDSRVFLRIPPGGFTEMLDELLRYSVVVSTNKLPKALTLLANQGVVLRERE